MVLALTIRALANETHWLFYLMSFLQPFEGGFGLVRCGDSVETCSDVFGEYLRYNNFTRRRLSSIGLPAGGVETVSLVSLCA